MLVPPWKAQPRHCTAEGLFAPRINEVARGTSGLVDVELFNASPQAGSLEGLALAAGDGLTNAIALSGTIGPGQLKSWQVPATNPLRIMLVASAGIVIDSVLVPDGVANYQAYPDGTTEWFRTSSASVGQPNPSPLQTNIVINEIMYDFPTGHGGAEFIELFNRGPEEVDLSHWQLTGAVRFVVPDRTHLAPNSFLVISRDATQMTRLYGEIPVIGDFKGHLASRGESVRLLDAIGNLADQVRYAGGGAWPEAARGAGSSLELLHPRMENDLPSAWAASDEAKASELVSCAVTGIYQKARAPGKPTDYKELHLYLADAGEAMVRDMELIHAGTNCLEHADQCGTGADGWLAQGTHWASGITNDELHLVADGHGDNRDNHLELDVPALEQGEKYELRFKARWLTGCPRLIVQSFDQSLAGSFALPIPDRLGTPGRANSRLLKVPRPQVDEIAHHPLVPKPQESVCIEARVHAIADSTGVRLWHRSDQHPDWTATPAYDDGRNGGDKVAGDGVYTAQIAAGSREGEVTQFYMEASDPLQTARCPVAARDAPAMFVADSRSLPQDLRSVRVVVWPGDVQTMGKGDPHFPRLSNHDWNATIIEEQQASYCSMTRPRGSPLTRTNDLERLNLKWPQDRPHWGEGKWIYDDDAAKGLAYHNRTARYLLYLFGQPVSDAEFVRLIVNAGKPVVREETETVGKEFLDRRFEEGRKGELYKIDDQWWLMDNGQGEMQDASWAYQGPESQWYQNAWIKRSRESIGDYRNLIDFFRIVSQTNSTQAEIEQFLNAESVLRLAAVRGFIGDWDNFTMQRGRNGYFYRPPGEGGFMLLHWDSDEGFMTGPPLYGDFIGPWLRRPENWSRFQQCVQEVIALTVDRPERLRTWLALEQTATEGVVFQATYLNFFRARAREVQEQNLAGTLQIGQAR
jgi:hypothetical protein